MAWFERMKARLAAWARLRLARQGHPETMVAALIATVWAVLATLEFSLPVMFGVLIVTWLVHGTAIESGQYVLLWMSTGMIVLMILVAVPLVLLRNQPLPLALAGSTALIYNEAIRFSYVRRRKTELSPSLGLAAGFYTAGAAVLGVFGVIMADSVNNQPDQSWLWMLSATIALVAVGLAFTVIPGREAPGTSSDRWEPGQRIPPQPLGREEFDQL
jgi:hypothetical protein